ncbi:hypothetical protein FOZ62_024625, partial [Perkinsus olseni]
DPPAQGGKDKKGAAAEGEAKEGKSDVEMEVLFPRFTITLTGTPKKGSPAEGHEGETYVGEVVVGAKLSGRLTRGKPYVSEEERERLEEERIAKEKEDKKNKKGKAKKGAAAVPEEPPMIKQYSWEVGNRGGVAIDDVMEDAPPGEEGTPPAVPMTDLWGYMNSWVELTGSNPESWEIIFVRTRPVEELTESQEGQPGVEEDDSQEKWESCGTCLARITLPGVLDTSERDEDDVMEALAVLCGVDVARLRPISLGVRENRSFVNFRISSDLNCPDKFLRSSEDLLSRMEQELGGDPMKEGTVIEFLRKLRLTDEDDEDDTDTRPSDYDDESETSGSPKGSFSLTRKSTFTFETQSTFQQAVVAAVEVNDYSRGRPVLTRLGNLGVMGGGMMTCRVGHGVSVRTMDELKKDVGELRRAGKEGNPVCAKYEDMRWRRCDWCDREPLFFEYRCIVCDDHGWVCGLCAVGDLVVCPMKHSTCRVQSCTDEHFIPCEGCGTAGRQISIECAFGGHYRRWLCSDCAAREVYGAFLSSAEPLYGGAPLRPSAGIVQHLR